MLAFSTSWNSDGRFTSRALLGLVEGFGFDAIELSHSHTAGDVDEITRLCRERGLSIVSVHNFCPKPVAPPGRRPGVEPFLLSATDESERRSAVEHTRRSIGIAASVGARAIIIHLGRVEIPARTRRLADLYVQGRKKANHYGRERDRLIGARARRGRLYLDNALKSLDDLCRDAERSGVALAIENRYSYREIPTLEELGEIFTRFAGAPVVYWHDTGHAQIMENLGFWRHEDLLHAAGRRLAGFHVHDVLLCEDHRPPPLGMIDFRRFREYWKPGTMKILEFSPVHSQARVEKGIRYIRDNLREWVRESGGSI